MTHNEAEEMSISAQDLIISSWWEWKDQLDNILSPCSVLTQSKHLYGWVCRISSKVVRQENSILFCQFWRKMKCIVRQEIEYPVLCEEKSFKLWWWYRHDFMAIHTDLNVILLWFLERHLCYPDLITWHHGTAAQSLSCQGSTPHTIWCNIVANCYYNIIYVTIS